MSYDLRLMRPRAGETLEETAERDSDDDDRFAPLVPQKEATKRRVADLLRQHDTTLAEWQLSDKEIARLQKISLKEARQCSRHIELIDQTAGLQVMLFDDEAAVTVPYWHQGEKAEAIMRRFLTLSDIVCRETGWLAYDQQIGRAVTIADLDDITATYVDHVRHLHAQHGAEQHSVEPKRPWWKFW